MNKAVFLDRDGVINESYVINGIPHPPSCVEATKLTEGIKELLEYLNEMGFILVVVTNQPDVAHGKQTRPMVKKINKYLGQELSIDEFLVCYHSEEDTCNCRKPRVGLFLRAAAKYLIDFSQSIVIGDRWSDIEAGKRIGAKTIFVDYGYKEKKPDNPDFTVKQINEIKNIFEKELQ
jgi:D-glycero-D-manno-heptose 1,7-bisphosphate phosphatase